MSIHPSIHPPTNQSTELSCLYLLPASAPVRGRCSKWRMIFFLHGTCDDIEIFFCHEWGRGASATWWVGPRRLLDTLQCPHQSRQRRRPSWAAEEALPWALAETVVFLFRPSAQSLLTVSCTEGTVLSLGGSRGRSSSRTLPSDFPSSCCPGLWSLL